jgi:hypothetical protein
LLNELVSTLSDSVQLAADQKSAMADAVSLSFLWEPIGALSLDQAGKLVFRQAPTAPGVYRFEIDGDGAWV